MFNVQVLVSTYNGESFVVEQLKSIANQENVNMTCLIRDDGSWDQTVKKVRSFCEADSRFKFFTGDNIGTTKSFLDLILHTYENDYYAFSDQDDIWDADKLNTAIQLMRSFEPNEPILYCSNLRLVDSNGQLMGQNYNIHVNKVDKANALVKNIATGCTIVFNRTARDLALRYIPNTNLLHDHWMYLLCVFMGKVVYDEIPHISYRQHNANFLGAEKDFASIWKKRIAKLRKNDFNQRETAAKELLAGYRELLSPEDIWLINIIAGYRDSLKLKLKLLVNKNFKMNSKESDLWLKLQILFDAL